MLRELQLDEADSRALLETMQPYFTGDGIALQYDAPLRWLARGDKVQLRQSPKQYMKRVVDQFNLTKWVGQEEAREKLIQAGYRGQAPYVTYLFFRMVSPHSCTALMAASLSFGCEFSPR